MTSITPTSSNKRPRTNSLSSNAWPSNTRPSKEVWYEDGNVVLIAEDVAFKVHRSILCRSSDVFRDMFEVAQPSPSTPIDGLPTVHLSDTPEELAVFLKLVYFPGEDPYFRSFEVAAPMQWVSTALRLGRKYQVTYIADEAVGRLKRVCPSSIGELKERYKTIEDYEGGGMAIAIVNLARAFDLPELLPVALYYCCQLSNNILVHGVTHRNGTKDQLSPEDLVRCLEGRKTFLCSNILLTNEIAGRTIGCGDCFRRTPLDQDPHLSYDILFSDLGPFDHDTIDQEEYCHLCLSSLEVRVRDIQVTTFRDLPIIFGL